MMFKSSFEWVWAEEAARKQAIAEAALHKASTPLQAAAEAGVTHRHGPWCYPDGKMPDDDERQDDGTPDDDELTGADRLPAAEGTYESLPDYTKGKKGRKRQLRELQYVVAHHLDHDHAEDSILPAGQPDEPPGPAEMVGVPNEPGDADALKVIAPGPGDHLPEHPRRAMATPQYSRPVTRTPDTLSRRVSADEMSRVQRDLPT